MNKIFFRSKKSSPIKNFSALKKVLPLKKVSPLKFFLPTIIFLLMLLPTKTFASAESELMCAFASLAAYSSDTGQFVRDEIVARGWSLEPIEAYASKADAKALLLRRIDREGRVINILSICGTEDQKDAEIDLRVELVNFDGGGMVHRGFNDYVDVLLDAERINALINHIRYSNEKLYLTGHSLGGAVAILTAARLTELGLGDRIEVITFGAPAVGDQSFVDRFDGRFPLTRITVSGDPIKRSLRSLGYKHLGESIKYKPADSVEHFRHKMAVYLDCALRNYYDDAAPTYSELDDADAPKIYVAPLRIVKESFDPIDEKYIIAIVRDVLRSRTAGIVFDPVYSETIDRRQYNDDFTDVSREDFAAARSTGCDRVLIQLIRSETVRESRSDIDRITLERIVCDLNGFPLSMQTSSMTTNEVTALEAILFAQLKSSI